MSNGNFFCQRFETIITVQLSKQINDLNRRHANHKANESNERGEIDYRQNNKRTEEDEKRTFK